VQSKPEELKYVTMLVKDVEQFAKSCCQQDTEDPYLYAHVQLVREFAVRLAHIENADGEVCEIAALLHDIGKCKGRKDHHITGRELAEQFLKTQPLPEEKKDLILKCILKHRNTISSEDDEIEVRILQSADCLGALFHEEWQEHCRKTKPREELKQYYTEGCLQKLTRESARAIALPQLENLKEKLSTQNPATRK
jgi:putative nucleotidyltransferase with HDIG domain